MNSNESDANSNISKIREGVKEVPEKLPLWVTFPISLGKGGFKALITIEIAELLLFFFIGIVAAFTLHFWFIIGLGTASATVYCFGQIAKWCHLRRE